MTDMAGWTPLHIAANENKHFICHILLRRGASPDIKNRENKSPKDLVKDELTLAEF